MKLIDKDALVAEIEKMMAEEMSLYKESLDEGCGETSASPVAYTRLQMLLSFIDSLQNEPKWKVGDIIRQGSTTAKILEISEDGYHCVNAYVPFSAQDEWELVEESFDIEIPLGAKDSELMEATYYIPEGCHAVIEGDKVVIRKD